MQGLVEGRNVLIGSHRLMQQRGIDLGPLASEAEARAAEGATPLFVALDGQAAATLSVSDPVKPGTEEALERLHQMGLTVAMVTGDNARTAQALADRLGIDHVTAEVLPDGKVDAITALRDQFGTLAFVGDGINDAPALATADIGIAIGTGTDVAIETADVVLMSGDLRGVANATEISRRTMRNIRQNLGWAFGYNVLLIPVAAGALYPFGGHLCLRRWPRARWRFRASLSSRTRCVCVAFKPACRKPRYRPPRRCTHEYRRCIRPNRPACKDDPVL